MPPEDQPASYEAPDLPDSNAAGYGEPDLPDSNAAGYGEPDLPDSNAAGYEMPDLPDSNASGYTMPDLPDSPSAGQAAAQDDPATQEFQQGRFQMKPLGKAYQDGEKNTAAKTVQMDGQDIQVHEKDWLRKQTDADRASKGQAPVTDEVWEDNVATTQYMDDAQRQDHQMHLRPGVDATGAENMRLSGESLQKGGEHIFVMDGEGQVFAKEGQAALNQMDDTARGVHVHHSSFLAGEAVAGAGEMKVDKQGFINEITDRSGHYKPGENQTTQTLNELENQGVNLNNVKFTMDRGEDKTKGMANEYRQGGEEVFKARHNVADEIKQRGQSVREKLDSDAKRRATRVEKAGEHLENGVAYADVSKGAQEHAAKDAAKLEGGVKAGINKQLNQQLDDKQKTSDVRKALGKDKDKAPAQGQSQGTGGAGKKSMGH